MDENTWRIVQIGMWVIGIQTTVIIAVMGALYTLLSNKIEKMEMRMGKLEDKMDKLESRMGHLENDMIEVKTVLRLKECCMIKDDRQMKRAE